MAPLLWITIVSLLCSISTEESVGPVEVCEREVFTPSCPAHQVVLVTKAQYGRMSLGRCVTKDYGFVGCSSDVTRTLVALCSGRAKCQVHASHPALLEAKATSCAKDFASYLSVTYRCVPVASGSRHSCRHEGLIALSATSGFIASASAVDSGLGVSDCPWKLLPSGGKRLNFTLMSFGTGDSVEAGSHPPCYKFATLQDKGGPQQVVGCVGDPSHKVIFISEGGPVTLTFSNDVIHGRMGHFLIKYNVVECEDPKIPANSRFTRRDAKTGEISCKNLDLKWTLQCEGGRWDGHVGRCENSGFGSIDTTSTYGLLAVVSIGALIGMLVGGLLLWICICCLRKCFRTDPHPRHLVPPEDLDYMTHFHKPWLPPPPGSQQPNWVDFGTMGRGHYETLPRPNGHLGPTGRIVPNGQRGSKEYDQLNVRHPEPEGEYFITIADNNNEAKPRESQDSSSS